jgi:hypothetical protein
LITAEHIRVGTFFGSIESSEEREVSWLESSFGFSLSADSSRVLINEQGEGSGDRYGLYLRPTDGSPALRLGDGSMGELSPDGKWVLSMGQDEPQRLTIYPTGPGDARVFQEVGLSYRSFGWFPDGKRIAFGASEGDSSVRLYVQDLSGGTPTPFTDEVMGVLGRLPISPDGRWAAALELRGRAVLWPSGGEPLPLDTLEPGDRPMKFSSDGGALFCARMGMDEATIVRLDLETRQRTIWRRLRPHDPAGMTTLSPSDVTPDGRHYIYIYMRLLSDLFLVEGLR